MLPLREDEEDGNIAFSRTSVGTEDEEFDGESWSAPASATRNSQMNLRRCRTPWTWCQSLPRTLCLLPLLLFRTRWLVTPQGRAAALQIVVLFLLAQILWRFRYYVLPVLPESGETGNLDGLPGPFLEAFVLRGSKMPGFCRRAFGLPDTGNATIKQSEFKGRQRLLRRGLQSASPISPWNSNTEVSPEDLTPLSPKIHALTESSGVSLPSRHYWQTLSIPDILAIRWKWQHYLRTSSVPYPDAIDLFGIKEGSKGIVTTVEGSSLRYMLTGLRVLRALNCSLDIEAWTYRGELTADQKKKVIEAGTGYGGRLVIREIETEAAAVHPKLAEGVAPIFLEKQRGRNYQIKVEAIVASQFESVIWLDGDNVVARDPAQLLVHPAFADTGAIFWPDYWRTAADNPIWQVAGVPYRYEYEFEAGQLYLHKPRVWCALMLALYFTHEPIHQSRFLWGDKDAFRFAWKAAGTPYHFVRFPVRPAGSRGQHGDDTRPDNFCANTMVQSHPTTGEPFFFHANALKYSPASSPDAEPGLLQPGQGGPFPWILAYKSDTDLRRMRPKGYRGPGGKWCVTLGGSGEEGVSMVWEKSDPRVGEMWTQAWDATSQ